MDLGLRERALGVVCYSGAWYLVAWCRLRKDVRHFRVDRIQTLTLLDELFPVRADFSLAKHLAERVERAARLISELRTKATRLEEERNALQQRLADTEGRLQGQDPSALVTEIAALRKEQRDWLAERREVTTRIEAISSKLERLE